MTEAAKVRDWLSELRGAAEDDNSDLFRSLVAMIATAQPDLKEPVCQLAGEYLENGETWAADFFKERKRVEPKRAEPPPKSEAVKVIGPAPYRRDRKPKPEVFRLLCNLALKSRQLHQSLSRDHSRSKMKQYR